MIYEGYHIFTPGPVPMTREVLEIGAQQTPYFRNSAFSDIVFNCERLLLNMVNAPTNSRVLFLTASGTAAMEAGVMNLLGEKDRALVVNGGGFGARFVEICATHKIPHYDFTVENSNLATIEAEAPDQNGEPAFTSLIVNGHETSLGHAYDLEALGRYCARHDLLHIVDAISLFVTDPLDMQSSNIDALILSSQKGLALPPGLSMLVLSPRAMDRLKPVRNMYFNFQDYLKNGERGQTPFTPAVTIMLQLNARLEQIEREGGIETCQQKAARIARHFRRSIKGLPLKEYSRFMPNAMTTLTPTNGQSAMEVVNDMEERYKIMICPNGGALRDKIFRVSHMGDMTTDYTDVLVRALQDYFSDGA